MVNDAAKTVPDQETRDTQTNNDANDGQDRHPLLLGVLLLHPGLLNLALLDEARVEEALGGLLVAAAHGAGRVVAGLGARRRRASKGIGTARVRGAVMR